MEVALSCACVEMATSESQTCHDRGGVAAHIYQRPTLSRRERDPLRDLTTSTVPFSSTVVERSCIHPATFSAAAAGVVSISG